MGALDGGRGLVARLCEHDTHDVLALAAGGGRQSRPSGSFAIAIEQPSERAGCGFPGRFARPSADRRTVLRIKFWRAVFGRETDARSMADSHIPDELAVARALTVKVLRARAGHGRHHRTISREPSRSNA